MIKHKQLLGMVAGLKVCVGGWSRTYAVTAPWSRASSCVWVTV